MNLKNVQWGEFEIGVEFNVKNSKAHHKSDLKEVKNNGISYVSRTNLRNGIESTVRNDGFKVNKSNTIVFGAENATFFYQPNEYITGNKMYYIEQDKINKYSGLFIQMMLNKSIIDCGFGYGKGLIGSRVKKRFIKLPTTPAGKPNYAFMEEFMRQKEEEKQNKFQNYIKKRIEEVKNFKEVEPLEQKEWGEFFLKEAFPIITRGKRLKKSDHIKGEMPYVSSSSVNNGIDGFVGNKKKIRIFEDCLSIANSGSVGATFYQSFPFVGSDHITHLKNNSFNEFIYIFIATITSRLSEKYSFNREINDCRIKREKILLPTNQSGVADYEYMENYIKRLEYQKLSNYLRIKQA